MIIQKEVPPLYSQEEAADPLVYVSVRIGQAYWLITEFDPQKQIAFGWAEIFPGGGELGYIHIPEIVAAIAKYGGEIVNYDEPQPLSKLKEEFQA